MNISDGIHPYLNFLISIIPNISALARQTDDVVFAEVFLSVNLLLVFGMAILLFVFVRDRFEVVRFASKPEKIRVIVVWLIFSGAMTSAAFFLPYPADDHSGRAEAFMNLIGSGKIGFVIGGGFIFLMVPHVALIGLWQVIFNIRLRPYSFSSSNWYLGGK